ncbi:phage tail protein [Thiothrix eikelboomii]|nr:phage tail protein [Thiothrix eikelboomii]
MVMPCGSLLPLNSSRTRFLEALECNIVPPADLDAAIRQLRGLKLDPPDILLPYLVWEYGLTAIVPYLPNLRVVIRDGLLWQKERGTEAGIRRALAWIGVDPDCVEDEIPGVHWNELQLDTGFVPSAEQLRRIIALTMMSTPARTKLKRLYHGCDRRRFVLDASRWGDLLDDYSGIRPPEYNGLVLSFCHRIKTSVQEPMDVAEESHGLIFGAVTKFINAHLLDEDFVFGELALPNHPAYVTLFFAQELRYLPLTTWLQDRWQQQPWNAPRMTSGAGVMIHHSTSIASPAAQTEGLKSFLSHANTMQFERSVATGTSRVSGSVSAPYSPPWRQNTWTQQAWTTDILIASDAA